MRYLRQLQLARIAALTVMSMFPKRGRLTRKRRQGGHHGRGRR